MLSKSPPALLGGTPAFAEPVPFVRPAMPCASLLEPTLREILCGGQLTKGKQLEAFETAVANHLGVEHAVAVSSCTTGLMLTYQGLGLEGEVVVPSFTFMATVSALVWAGLRPVFADVDPLTGTLSPGAAARAITAKTTAIVGVHTFGNPAAIDELESLARKHGLKLIFDAAHGFGSLYRGHPVGREGDAQVFSLSPTKLVVAGEGGIVATNDDRLARHIRIGREYGNDGRYDSLFAGFNARMPEINALIGRWSLGMLPETAARRNWLADLYRSSLESIPGIRCMEVRPDDRCSYKDFSIVVDESAFGMSRDELARALAAEKIDTRKYYSPPVHRHQAYARFAPQEERLPHTLALAASSLSLPMFTQLSEEAVLRIVGAVGRLQWRAADVRKALAEQKTAA